MSVNEMDREEKDDSSMGMGLDLNMDMTEETQNESQERLESVDERDSKEETLEEDEDGQFDDGDDDDEDDEKMANDLWLLQTAWQNEKNAPEILRYEGCVDAILKGVERQEGLIDDMDDRIQSIDSQKFSQEQGNFDAFALHLYKMELDRIRYMLNAYGRIRIWKIQKYVTHILSSAEMIERLSEKEKIFAENYADICEKAMQNSFLNEMPDEYKWFDAIVKAKLDRFVIVKVNESIPRFEISPGEYLPLETDDVMVAKYMPFRKILDEGYVDLM